MQTRFAGAAVDWANIEPDKLVTSGTMRASSEFTIAMDVIEAKALLESLFGNRLDMRPRIEMATMDGRIITGRAEAMITGPLTGAIFIEPDIVHWRGWSNLKMITCSECLEHLDTIRTPKPWVNQRRAMRSLRLHREFPDTVR